ncbi:rhomboid family intramembrane serine protease [Mycolicibacterium thermoresistibile]
MGMTGRGGYPARPGPSSPQPKRRPPWVVGGLTILSFVALLYVIEAYDVATGNQLDANGIRPLDTDGLSGVLFAPLLHGSWEHLMANTGPALVLGFLMTLAGMSRFIFATAIIWILGGIGTWLIGDLGAPAGVSTVHIGASGLIFGWLTFLIVFGFFTRKVWQITVGIMVLLVYGSILLGVLPGTFGVSWQGHLCGAIAGVIAAYVLSGPERKARALRRPVQPPPLYR